MSENPLGVETFGGSQNHTPYTSDEAEVSLFNTHWPYIADGPLKPAPNTPDQKFFLLWATSDSKKELRALENPFHVPCNLTGRTTREVISELAEEFDDISPPSSPEVTTPVTGKTPIRSPDYSLSDQEMNALTELFEGHSMLRDGSHGSNKRKRSRSRSPRSHLRENGPMLTHTEVYQAPEVNITVQAPATETYQETSAYWPTAAGMSYSLAGHYLGENGDSHSTTLSTGRSDLGSSSSAVNSRSVSPHPPPLPSGNGVAPIPDFPLNWTTINPAKAGAMNEPLQTLAIPSASSSASNSGSTTADTEPSSSSSSRKIRLEGPVGVRGKHIVVDYAKIKKIKTKSGETRYGCYLDDCGDSFSKCGDLVRHIRNAAVHQEHQPPPSLNSSTVCRLCGRDLSRKDARDRHEKRKACGKRTLPKSRRQQAIDFS